MTLTYRDNIFVWLGGYETRDLPKAARFRWNPDTKSWWTDDARKAAALREHADAAASAQLNGVEVPSFAASVADSRATDAVIDVPCPAGLDYKPFQRGGIAYALQRTACLIADEMGLGKTIQALGVCNARQARSILVICPASLKINWSREARRWLVTEHSIGIAAGDDWPTSDVVIVNYDILKRHRDVIRSKVWDCVIIDEAHFTKNRTAARTREVWGHWEKGSWKIQPIRASYKLALTGTPIVNRPVEAFPILNGLDSKAWPNFFSYAKQFCAAHQKSIGRGRMAWDFSGASNLDELQRKLRATLMIRRLKSEVLTELPPKTRQVIELPTNGLQGLVDAELDAFAQHRLLITQLQDAVAAAAVTGTREEYAAAVEKLRQAASVAFSAMARTRHDVAAAKAPLVAEHVLDVLDQGVPHVVVFAHHHDVVDLLQQRFAAAGRTVGVVTGRESLTQRQAAVDAFQAGQLHVLIGNIQAAGVGITLTRASFVCFAEIDWVPGNISQAEDRCHRIGQRDGVQVQHLVLEGSLDAYMAKRVVEKQEVIDAALDTVAAPLPPPAPLPDRNAAQEDLGRHAFNALVEFLGKAHARGLKYPTIHLATASGQSVKVGRCGEQSRTPGAIRVTSDDAFGSPHRKYFGLIKPTGILERGRDCTDEVVAILRQLAEDPVGTAKLFAKRTNCCCFCAAELTNPPSVHAGYGPVCAQKYGLPWGGLTTPTDVEVLFHGGTDNPDSNSGETDVE